MSSTHTTYMRSVGTTLSAHPLLSSQGVRLIHMERLLRWGKPMPLSRLCPHASRAQFKRDLSTLREDFGATIEYYPGEGYVLTDLKWPGLLPLVLQELGRPPVDGLPPLRPKHDAWQAERREVGELEQRADNMIRRMLDESRGAAA